MKTLKLNLDDPVTNISASQDESGNSISSENAQMSEEEYRQKVQKLENQIKLLENSLQNAREEAFQAGIEDGKEQAQREFQKVEQKYEQNFQNLINSIEEEFETALKSSVEPLINLTYTIAKKVIERELKYKKEYSQFVQKQLNKHISDIIDQGRLTIQIHPDQINHITKEDLNNELSSQNKVQIVENTELEPGDCVIETSDIKIDARIDRQLENLKSQNDNLQ